MHGTIPKSICLTGWVEPNRYPANGRVGFIACNVCGNARTFYVMWSRV